MCYSQAVTTMAFQTCRMQLDIPRTGGSHGATGHCVIDNYPRLPMRRAFSCLHARQRVRAPRWRTGVSTRCSHWWKLACSMPANACFPAALRAMTSMQVRACQPAQSTGALLAMLECWAQWCGLAEVGGPVQVHVDHAYWACLGMRCPIWQQKVPALAQQHALAANN